MRDYLDERLTAGAARLEQEATVHSPAGVRARGDQRRRRHTATMAVVPVAVLAIAGSVGLTSRPSGGPSRPNLGSSPSVSDTRTSAAGTTPTTKPARPTTPTGPARSATLVATVDLARHTLIVLDAQGKLVKTLPITAGSSAHPTQTGTFTVAGKEPSKELSSPMGPNTYSLTVTSFIDLGPNAPTIYAMPWWPDSLGMRNTTTGEIGLSTDDAAWFYTQLAVGDTIRIASGTAG
ncbi:lipoprotein-anchoring transpeptidase ErfK/SrfK [Catenulispora sp. MAP12-49]|uniref:L,D-transpeptidase n=1 Tax=Catenulispora sp. MAP12-49 TaxID=3156302 RepID=UPI003516EEC7